MNNDLNLEDIRKDRQASNVEINSIKLGVKTFQLYAGDKFIDNGKIFMYHPSTNDNKIKLPYSLYSRTKSISVKKYKKYIINADNIVLISDENNIKTYMVNYAYKDDEVKLEPLYLSYIDIKNMDKINPEFIFNSKELEVERITDKYIVLKNSNPIDYRSRIDKDELNNVQVHYNKYFIFYHFDNLEENQEKLFKKYQEHLEINLISAIENVKYREKKIENFKHFKEKYGYINEDQQQ
jgi:hypothetical protein